MANWTISEKFIDLGGVISIDLGSNYQVKRISENPRARLNLQRHKHRAEHWVVVSGLATAHSDSNEHILEANDSIYIKVGDYGSC